MEKSNCVVEKCNKEVIFQCNKCNKDICAYHSVVDELTKIEWMPKLVKCIYCEYFTKESWVEHLKDLEESGKDPNWGNE